MKKIILVLVIFTVISSYGQDLTDVRSKDSSLKNNEQKGDTKYDDDDDEFNDEEVKSTVIHSSCFVETGSITANYLGQLYSPAYPTYSWTLEGTPTVIGTNETITGLAPGTYAVVIRYGPDPSHFIVRTYTIGYKVNWTDKVNTEIESIINPGIGLTNTLVNNQGGAYGTNGGASCNTLSSFTPGWAEFTVNDAINDYLVFGLSEENLYPDKASIEYGIELIPYEVEPNEKNGPPTLSPVYLYQVVENGNPVTPEIANYTTGDKFTIIRDPNGEISYYKNSTTNPFYISNETSTSKLIVDVAMNAANATILDANVSFNCEEVFKYAVLRKKLDVSYYEAGNGRLRFKYLEKYRGGDLNYKIYNNLNQVIADGNNNPIQKVYGDNWLTLDAFSIIGSITNDYYILEVIDEKGRKEYLRFQVIESIVCD